MKIVIIGHGESPKGKGWGPEIDRHVVVRLKNPSWQRAEDYGSRCDYMAASTETLPVMLDYKVIPKEYWGQPKRGVWNPSIEAGFRARAKAPLKIPIDVYLPWFETFKELRKKPDTASISLGLSAIIFASYFLKPDGIRLVGFDNLLDPSLWEYKKADRGKWVTRHEWDVENSMIPLIEQEYGVNVSAY